MIFRKPHGRTNGLIAAVFITLAPNIHYFGF